MLLRRAEPDDHHRVAGLELVLLGDERRRRRVEAADHHVDVGRQRGDHVPRVAPGQQPPGPGPRTGSRSAPSGPPRAAGTRTPSRSPKLPPPPRRAQNRSAFSVLGRHEHVAGSRDHAGGEQVVDGQPVLAGSASPMPPPSVSPPTPVWLISPTGTAEPVRLGGGVDGPAATHRRRRVARRATGSTRDLVHAARGRSPDRRPRRTCPPCCAPRRARPPRGRWQRRTGSAACTSGLVGTARDGERAAVTAAAFPDAAALVVRRVVGADDLATRSAAKLVDRGARGLGHGVPPSGARRTDA